MFERFWTMFIIFMIVSVVISSISTDKGKFTAISQAYSFDIQPDFE